MWIICENYIRETGSAILTQLFLNRSELDSPLRASSWAGFKGTLKNDLGVLLNSVLPEFADQSPSTGSVPTISSKTVRPKEGDGDHEAIFWGIFSARYCFIYLNFTSM